MVTEQDVLEKLKTVKEGIAATPDVVEARNNTCNGCDKKSSILGVDNCSACGCVLMFKTRFTFARCPLDKWEAPQPDFNILGE